MAQKSDPTQPDEPRLYEYLKQERKKSEELNKTIKELKLNEKKIIEESKKKYSKHTAEIGVLKTAHELETQRLYEHLKLLEKENEILHQTVAELRLSEEELIKNYIVKDAEIKHLKAKTEFDNHRICDEFQQLRKRNDSLNQTVAELRIRLTKNISDKLTEDNPSFENLSDPNRRTKLAERFSELYCNEWTDAFEELNFRFSNEISIKVLLSVLEKSYEDSLQGKNKVSISSIWIQFWEEIAKCQEEKQCHITKPRPENNDLRESSVDKKIETNSYENEEETRSCSMSTPDNKISEHILKEDDSISSGDVIQTTGIVNDENTPGQEKNQNEEQISSTEQFGEDLGQGDMESDQNKEENESNEQKSPIKKVQIYIKTMIFAEECVKLCWKMVTKEPPMHLEFDFKDGEKFDTKILRPYTETGGLFAYLVWPPLFDYKSGHLMKAGIAQAKTRTTTQKAGTTKCTTF